MNLMMESKWQQTGQKRVQTSGRRRKRGDFDKKLCVRRRYTGADVCKRRRLTTGTGGQVMVVQKSSGLDTRENRCVGQRGRRQQIRGRKRSGTLVSKFSTVYQLAQQKWNLRRLRLHLPQRIDQQGSVLHIILDAGSQERKQCLNWIVGRVIVEVNCGSDNIWRPP